jgi:hypothetical protein
LSLSDGEKPPVPFCLFVRRENGQPWNNQQRPTQRNWKRNSFTPFMTQLLLTLVQLATSPGR